MAQFLDVGAAADFMECKPVTIRRLVKRGELTAYKKPGSKQHQYKRTELEKAKKVRPVPKKIH